MAWRVAHESARPILVCNFGTAGDRITGTSSRAGVLKNIIGRSLEFGFFGGAVRVPMVGYETTTAQFDDLGFAGSINPSSDSTMEAQWFMSPNCSSVTNAQAGLCAFCARDQQE